MDIIECELRQYVTIKNVDWFNEYEFDKYEKNLGFQEVYDKQNNKHIEAYALDLEVSKYKELPYYLQEDAAKTHKF